MRKLSYNMREEASLRADDLPESILEFMYLAADALDTLEKEIAEHKASFDLRWEAETRAIKRWQEANPGNDLVWPDHVDLCVWLMDALEAA